ncbi:MAG: LD-carboxypeptidase [Alphaproteobacteria bacterium]|nr:LD-carboxypeptidase [Alphaproteobacteria bacterium]
MARARKRIGVVAPGARLEAAAPDAVAAIADALYGAEAPEIIFHPQCFLQDGHFAGPDAARAAAFLDVANDPAFDAVWFARGGYGACRMVEAAADGLAPAARDKLYLGYSDAGVLLAMLDRAGCRVAHGPMASDFKRAGGDAAIKRALRFLVERAPDTIEPSARAGVRAAAFNITILSTLIATPYEPDLSGRVLMLEDVGEYLYRIDRELFHILSSPAGRRAAGVRLGRVSEITPNDPPFALNEEEIVRHWCARAGMAYLGRADIGHDSGNMIVPFFDLGD